MNDLQPTRYDADSNAGVDTYLMVCITCCMAFTAQIGPQPTHICQLYPRQLSCSRTPPALSLQQHPFSPLVLTTAELAPLDLPLH